MAKDEKTIVIRQPAAPKKKPGGTTRKAARVKPGDKMMAAAVGGAAIFARTSMASSDNTALQGSPFVGPTAELGVATMAMMGGGEKHIGATLGGAAIAGRAIAEMLQLAFFTEA